MRELKVNDYSMEKLPVHFNDGFFGKFGDKLEFLNQQDCSLDSPQLEWRAPNAKAIKVVDGQERHSLMVYLRWAFTHQVESPPLTVVRAGGDFEPDFIIYRGAVPCGLEETKATTTEYERFTDEILGVKPPSGNPNYQSYQEQEYFGLCVEKDWAELVASSIVKKMKKLKNRYLSKLSACDLLLRHVGATGPMSEFEPAIQFLKARMAKIYQENPSAPVFRKIHVVAEDWAMLDVLGDDCKLCFPPDRDPG